MASSPVTRSMTRRMTLNSRKRKRRRERRWMTRRTRMMMTVIFDIKYV